MIYALKRTAEEFREELDRYGIEVKPEINTIIMPDRAIRLDSYTQSRTCRKVLRDCIKELKAKAEAKQREQQTSLLPEESTPIRRVN